MHRVLILVLATSVIADPRPTGGANCSSIHDCGGLGYGECIENQCLCYEEYGDPNCSYKRTSKQFAGGMQFLCFIGIGGVGEFIAGNTGFAVAELLLLSCASFIGCCIFLGLALCCNDAEDGIAVCVQGLVLCMGMAGFLMCIIRGALILEGKVNDGDGYAMY